MNARVSYVENDKAGPWLLVRRADDPPSKAVLGPWNLGCFPGERYCRDGDASAVRHCAVLIRLAFDLPGAEVDEEIQEPRHLVSMLAEVLACEFGDDTAIRVAFGQPVNRAVRGWIIRPAVTVYAPADQWPGTSLFDHVLDLVEDLLDPPD